MTETQLARVATASLAQPDAEETVAESAPLAGRARTLRLAFKWLDQVLPSCVTRITSLSL